MVRGDSMTTYLLTWNPSRWHWADLPQTAEQTAAGQTLRMFWSCGNSTVTLRVTDAHGLSADSTATINVTDTAPRVSIVGRKVSNPSRPYVLRLSSSDPGQDTIRSWTINWGDGKVQTVSGDRVKVRHRYALRTQRYVITAVATDDD